MTLPITKLKGGLFPKYRLDKDYKFVMRYLNTEIYFTIPAGFEYDGATFGSFLFWRKPMHETAETLAHDWVYENLGHVDARYLNHAKMGKVTQEQADDMYLQALRRKYNVQGWRDRIASGAFKTIGWLLWKKRELLN